MAKSHEHRSRKRSPEAIEFARQQRANANEFARNVWQMVRARRCRGQKFRREYPIPPYTVDFCCIESKLIIEVDGADHFTEEGKRHDAIRDKFLTRMGFRILRIPGFEVIRNGQEVLQSIEDFVDQRRNEMQNNTPSPPRGRGELK